jgi:plasmid stabilization system protein ParE
MFANGRVARLGSMASLIVCSAAEADYTESLCWYAERSTTAADDFDEEFSRALNEIVSDPLRFPSCDLRHRFYLMRRFPFRVIYRVDGDDVFIMAVAHAARSPDYWTNR